MRRKMFCVLSAILLMTSTAYGQEITKGVRIECGMGAKIGEGDIFVPLRAVSEALDCDVQWNEEQQRVDITYKEEFDIEEAKANLPEGWSIED